MQSCRLIGRFKELRTFEAKWKNTRVSESRRSSYINPPQIPKSFPIPSHTLICSLRHADPRSKFKYGKSSIAFSSKLCVFFLRSSSFLLFGCWESWFLFVHFDFSFENFQALPNQQTVDYPSFKLVIVGDGGTGNFPLRKFVFCHDLLFFVSI